MRFAPLLLAVLCFVVLFVGLDRVGYLDDREARDAQVAREMIDRREVITPHSGGEPRFEKPAPAYALEALSHLLAPSSLLPSRVVRALEAVALVLLTALVGAQYFGLRAGWCAAAVLASSLALPLAARTDGTQLLATLLGWVGCAGLADAMFGRSAGREQRLVVAYGALGASLVAAGPLPALWPLGGLALYLYLRRDSHGWSRVRPWLGLAIMAGLALPWYGAMSERHGAAFLAHAPFLPYGEQPRGAWYSGPVFAIAFLVVGFFPWSTLLPGAALHAATWWREVRGGVLNVDADEVERPGADPLAREWREESAAHFFLACLVMALVPIAAYPGPPLAAALPALPAGALLCGRLLDHLLEDAPRVREPIGNAVRMLVLVGTAGAILLTLVSARVRGASQELRLLGAILLLASWAPFLAHFVQRSRAAAMLLLLPVAVGAPLVSLRLLPAMEDYLNARSVGEAMEAIAPERAALVLAEPAPPSLRLYLRRNLIVGAPLASALEELRATDGLTYVAFRPTREKDVAHAARGPLEIVIRTPTLVLARVHRE